MRTAQHRRRLLSLNDGSWQLFLIMKKTIKGRRWKQRRPFLLERVFDVYVCFLEDGQIRSLSLKLAHDSPKHHSGNESSDDKLEQATRARRQDTPTDLLFRFEPRCVAKFASHNTIIMMPTKYQNFKEWRVITPHCRRRARQTSLSRRNATGKTVCMSLPEWSAGRWNPRETIRKTTMMDRRQLQNLRHFVPSRRSTWQTPKSFLMNPNMIEVLET